MPWSADDADKHKSGLSDEQKKKWAKIANRVLADSGDEGKAIRIANSQVSKALIRKIAGLDEPSLAERAEIAKHLIGQHEQKKHGSRDGHSRSEHQTGKGAFKGAKKGAAAGAGLGLGAFGLHTLVPGKASPAGVVSEMAGSRASRGARIGGKLGAAGVIGGLGALTGAGLGAIGGAFKGARQGEANQRKNDRQKQTQRAVQSGRLPASTTGDPVSDALKFGDFSSEDELWSDYADWSTGKYGEITGGTSEMAEYMQDRGFWPKTTGTGSMKKSFQERVEEVKKHLIGGHDQDKHGQHSREEHGSIEQPRISENESQALGTAASLGLLGATLYPSFRSIRSAKGLRGAKGIKPRHPEKLPPDAKIKPSRNIFNRAKGRAKSGRQSKQLFQDIDDYLGGMA